jgi:CRISPR-associated endonuclease/helicase Cas3
MDLQRAREALRHALGDVDPFPWQEELLKQMAQGCIPESVDIPTGLGKTVVMAILWARAYGPELHLRIETTPTREVHRWES